MMNMITSAHICLSNEVMRSLSALMRLTSFTAELSPQAIKTLEDSRIGLQDARSHDFSRLLLMTKLVAIGVILEGPELVYAIFNAVKRWRKRSTGEHDPEWIIVLGLVGWVLVSIGVGGEFWVDGKVNTDDDNIQSINITLLRDAGASAAQARSDANNAHNLARSASDIAKPAKETAEKAAADAGKARDKADAVGRKADGLDTQLASARAQLEAVENKRAKLEKSLVNMAVCNAPRVLLDWTTVLAGKVQTNVDSLRPMVGQKALIEFVPDAEARRAAKSLRRALIDAKWDVLSVLPVDELEDGVSVQPFKPPLEPSQTDFDGERRASDAADKLIDFLHLFNWQAQWGFPTDGRGHIIRDPNILPVGAIRIQIGLYPAVEYVIPPGERELSITGAKIEQETQKRRKETREKVLKEHPEIATYLAEDDQRLELEEERRAGPCHSLSGLPIVH